MAKTMIFAVLMAMVCAVNALSLLPCKEYNCKAVTCGSRGSYTTEVTGGCCSACYQLIGEQCGGIHNRLGECAQGLECFSNDTHDGIHKPRGICQRKTPTVRLPRKWESLLKGGKVTRKLRLALSRLFRKIKEINRFV